MSSDQPVPLIDVRGIGPSLVTKLEQCGISTANQLADMTVAEFKENCPILAKKGGALVKGARRLLKRRDIAQAIAASDTISGQELTDQEVSPQVGLINSATVPDLGSEPMKKDKKAKKEGKDKKAYSDTAKDKEKKKEGKSKEKKKEGKSKEKKKKDGKFKEKASNDKTTNKSKGYGKSKKENKKSKKQQD